MNFGAGLLGGFGIYVVKPIVLIMALVLVIKFWRLKAVGARMTVLGVFSFFIGEFICAIESYVVFQIHPGLDILHSIFSGIAFSLIILGLFQFFDKYFLHYLNEDKPCFFVRFCEQCPKRSQLKCKFHSVVIWSLILLILVACAPLLMEVKAVTANPLDYKLPWLALNNFYDQTLYPFMQQYLGGYTQEDLCNLCVSYDSRFVLDRVFPLVSLAALLAGLALFLAWKERAAVVLISIGLGVIGFTYFEIVLYKINPYLYIGSVGEELVELLSLLILLDLFRVMKFKVEDSREAG